MFRFLAIEDFNRLAPRENENNLFHCFSKLLKMHETKYQPMEKADAEQIMEEILGMQCGLNPDQQVIYKHSHTTVQVL